MDRGLEAIHDALRAFIWVIRLTEAAKDAISAAEVRVEKMGRLRFGCRWRW